MARGHDRGASTGVRDSSARRQPSPVESQQNSGSDIKLLSMFPHMHLRGKDFHYEPSILTGEGNAARRTALRFQLAEQLYPDGT